MPIHPEYIPLPKGKEMFAIASWRDSSGPTTATAATTTATTAAAAAATAHPGVHVSPHLGSLDAFRNGKMSAMPCAATTTTTTTTNTSTAAPGGLLLPSAMTLPDDDRDTAKVKQQQQQQQATAAAGAAAAGKKKKRKSSSAAAGAAGAGARADDVDDFFVHILLPAGVAGQTLEYELQAQVTPLRTIEVGPPKVLFPRKPTNAGTGVGDASPPTTTTLAPAPAPAALVLSPFRTPAVNPASSELGLPPMSLPPADYPAPATAGGAGAGPAAPTTTTTTGAAAAGAAGTQPNGNGATASAGHHGGDFQVSLLFAEKAEAEKTLAFVQRRWPTAAVSLASRSRSVLNATLVLKGMPNQTKTETVLAELHKLPQTPSYVRLLRSERGVFKSVVFVKYANCQAAEECKLRLEQLVLGSRPLKVEFKKKSATAAAAAAAVSADGGTAAAENKRSLQDLVRDLRVSSEHEGFHLTRAEVAKEELKTLKQLCHSYGLLFDMNDQRVTVRRVLGTNGTGSEKPSPALRPQSTTPAWAPATPAPLRPKDFKGISHWKDIRSQTSTLGIVRPLGPEDGKAAFSAGRGRPL